MANFVLDITYHRYYFCDGSNFMHVNSLPNDKFVDRSKLTAFAVDKINMTEKSKFVLGRIENIVRNG